MKAVLSMIAAAMFATVSVSALAASHSGAKKDDMKKPTAEECKKDPKMKGCEPAKK